MTLGQAREELKATNGAYGADDLNRSINKAMRALVNLHPLRCFRRIYRFVSAGPGFVLPQGCAGLVRACVNGRPVTMRGQDFKFMLSGPGDMNRPPFRPFEIDNICSYGEKPVMVEPHAPFRVFAYVEGDADQPALTVRGYSPEGREVVARPKPYSHEMLVDGLEFEAETPVFTEITSVTLDKEAGKYVTLCALDDFTERSFSIAFYNPRELSPAFMHYELLGWPPGKPVEILAEVRMGHIDAIEDSDRLLIDTVEPIEWMIRADWEMKSGETQKAATYRAEAEKWLRRQEVVKETVQTKLTINSDYYGSPGEISDEAFNI